MSEPTPGPLSRGERKKVISVTAKHVVYQSLQMAVESVCEVLKVDAGNMLAWERDEIKKAVEKITKIIVRQI